MIAYPPAFDRSHVILVRSQAIATDLDSYLSRIDPGEARLATSYIFQILPGLREELSRSQADHVRADLLARTPDRNLYTLAYISDRHELCRITTTGLELLEPAEMDSALRRACDTELHRLVEKAADHCFYRATSIELHLVTISLRHQGVIARFSCGWATSSRLVTLWSALRSGFYRQRPMPELSSSITGVLHRWLCVPFRHRV